MFAEKLEKRRNKRQQFYHFCSISEVSHTVYINFILCVLDRSCRFKQCIYRFTAYTTSFAR